MKVTVKFRGGRKVTFKRLKRTAAQKRAQKALARKLYRENGLARFQFGKKAKRNPGGKRKAARYEYRIEGHYAYGWEMVDASETRAEALENLRLYRENEPGTAFRLRKVRETN